MEPGTVAAASSGCRGPRMEALEPPRHDHLLLGVKRHCILAMRMQVPEERLLPACEREERHGRRHTDIYAHHANLNLLRVVAGSLAVARKDGRGVAERAIIHKLNGIVQRV